MNRAERDEYNRRRRVLRANAKRAAEFAAANPELIAQWAADNEKRRQAPRARRYTAGVQSILARDMPEG